MGYAHRPLLHYQGVVRDGDRRWRAGGRGRGERDQGNGDEPTEADWSGAVGGIEPETDPLAERRDHPPKPACPVGDKVYRPHFGEILPLGRGVTTDIPPRAPLEIEEQLPRTGREGNVDDRPNEIGILTAADHRQPIRPAVEPADRAVGMPAVIRHGEIGHDARPRIGSRRAEGSEEQGKTDGCGTETRLEEGHGIGRWSGIEARRDATNRVSRLFSPCRAGEGLP